MVEWNCGRSKRENPEKNYSVLVSSTSKPTRELAVGSERLKACATRLPRLIRKNCTSYVRFRNVIIRARIGTVCKNNFFIWLKHTGMQNVHETMFPQPENVNFIVHVFPYLGFFRNCITLREYPHTPPRTSGASVQERPSAPATTSLSRQMSRAKWKRFTTGRQGRRRRGRRRRLDIGPGRLTVTNY